MNLLLSILFQTTPHPSLGKRKIDSTNSCKNRVQSGDALDIDGWEEYMDELDGPIKSKSKDELDK